MNIMATRTPAAQRHVRYGGIIALLFAATAVLAGCSSAAPQSLDSAARGPEVGSGADLAYPDAGTAEVGTAEVNQSAPTGRSLIVTGSMYMTVDNPIAAADQATEIVDMAGGRIDARSETAPDEYDGGSASLTLRVPADNLDAVVEDLRELGTVDQFRTDSYDVTNKVIDLEAKISTLRASTARIEALLVDAKDISDIITLENELDSRQAELESLEARQRGLSDQVSMSTIDLSLTTEPVVIIKDNPKTFWDGVVAGWNGLTAFVSNALVAIGVVLPWLIVMALIGLGAVALARSARSRRARRAATSDASDASAAPSAPPAPTPPSA